MEEGYFTFLLRKRDLRSLLTTFSKPAYTVARSELDPCFSFPTTMDQFVKTGGNSLWSTEKNTAVLPICRRNKCYAGCYRTWMTQAVAPVPAIEAVKTHAPTMVHGAHQAVPAMETAVDSRISPLPVAVYRAVVWIPYPVFRWRWHMYPTNLGKGSKSRRMHLPVVRCLPDCCSLGIRPGVVSPKAAVVGGTDV